MHRTNFVTSTLVCIPNCSVVVIKTLWHPTKMLTRSYNIHENAGAEFLCLVGLNESAKSVVVKAAGNNQKRISRQTFQHTLHGWPLSMHKALGEICKCKQNPCHI